MTSTNTKTRIDQYLTNAGLAPSRSRARDMVSRGCVKANGIVVSKAGHLIRSDAEIVIDDPAQQYVSRAALKLIAGLDAAGINVSDKVALDLGASTGGFTQVLLERNAKKIISVDVGHSQMVDWIANDPRVTNVEGLNARHITEGDLDSKPQIIVSDLSFVSLRIGAEPALRLVSSNANCVLLVKPQFEVGKEGVGKGGLVTDDALIAQTLDEIKLWFSELPRWAITHFLPSPIKGGDGNVEYLLCGEHHA